MKLTENGVEFGYLTLDDYELLEAAVRANGIAFLKERIAEHKLPPADAFVAWRDARPDLVTSGQVYAYVRSTKAGAAMVLRKSLERAGQTDTGRQNEIIGTYDIENAGNLAAHLIGFEDRKFTGRMIPVEKPTHPTSSSASSPS